MHVTDPSIVAITLGDPAGIGPELTAKLLARNDLMNMARVVLIGDKWLWEEGQRIADKALHLQEITRIEEARSNKTDVPCFLAVDSVQPSEVTHSVASVAGGKSVLRVLSICLDAVTARQIDAICFAPLNKHAMKMGGLKFEDELHFFADYLKIGSFVCEFNTLGNIWTSRISSHVPFKDVVDYVDEARIKDSAKLLYQSLYAAGFTEPRVAVAALNPHAGDGGTCGREEIEIIGPAVRALRTEGYPIDGPFPADTIFIKARKGLYDGVVTMYHDQGQIAIKLMGFDRGVTVQGGLPVPITTPAHGTAYDIAGQNKADVGATVEAFLIACKMGDSYRAATPFNNFRSPSVC